MDPDRGDAARRPMIAGFLALFGLVCAHTLVETARDALFLVRVPVRLLPIVYLAVAAASVVVARVGSSVAARRGRVDPISASLVGGAVVTAGFWLAVGARLPLVVHVLYLWSSLFAAWVAGQIWSRLGAVLAADEARRRYGIIGTGAVLGACAGAALSELALSVLDVRHLLLVGAMVLLLAAGPAALLAAPRREMLREPAEIGADHARVRDVVRHPHLGRVLATIALAAMVGTLVDFAYKSEIARTIDDPVYMARLLAAVALGANLASLLVQAVGVSVAMRILGPRRSSFVLPTLVAGGAALALAGGGIVGVIAMRGIDGALRPSLQRTSVELLLLGIPRQLRDAAKAVTDLGAQRGGQSVASILILATGYWGAGSFLVQATMIVIVAAGWLWLARGIRRDGSAEPT